MKNSPRKKKRRILPSRRFYCPACKQDDRPYHARQMCHACYNRWYSKGIIERAKPTAIRKWSGEELSTLRRMLSEGYTILEILPHLNDRPRHGVYAMARKRDWHRVGFKRGKEQRERTQLAKREAETARLDALIALNYATLHTVPTPGRPRGS